MERGVIYVATGRDYVDLALQSALSLRASNPGLACDLFCDPASAPEGAHPFDQIHETPRVHARAKLDCLGLSRFQRTLFLDADTLVLADISGGFDLLDRFDLAICHDVRRASKAAREGLDPNVPDSFQQLNSGVIFYQKTGATQAFFTEWAWRFSQENVSRDQIILRDMLWETDLRWFVLPPEWNMRRITELDSREPLDGGIKILHSHRLLQHLTDPSSPRLRDVRDILLAERQALASEWALIDESDPIRRFDAVREGINAPLSDRGKKRG